MDEELREGTPRPWRVFAAQNTTEVQSRRRRRPVVSWPGFDDSAVPRREHDANARLIVAAVNDYDRLRRIEAAARGPVLGAFDVLASLREVARQAGNADLFAALEPARHAEAALRTALGED